LARLLEDPYLWGRQWLMMSAGSSCMIKKWKTKISNVKAQRLRDQKEHECQNQSSKPCWFTLISKEPCTKNSFHQYEGSTKYSTFKFWNVYASTFVKKEQISHLTSGFCTMITCFPKKNFWKSDFWPKTNTYVRMSAILIWFSHVWLLCSWN